MSSTKDNSEAYKTALDLMVLETQDSWQTFSAFLLIHTIFLAFLLNSALGENPCTFKLGAFIASILGLLLCIPWAVAYARTSSYVYFRIAQARSLEPADWNLIKGNGKAFAEGESITIEGKSYRMHWLARHLRMLYVLAIIIVIFSLVYITVLVLAGPWCPSAAPAPPAMLSVT